MDRIRDLIRDIPDFPVKGIVFKDICPVLQDPQAFNEVIDRMVDKYKDYHIDVIVGMESRGFIFGAPMALKMGVPFVLVRKAGKLPAETMKVDYTLEYGEATLEIHKDALEPGQRVLIVDDLLATGGTAAATIKLIENSGAKVVTCAFFIELGFLGGRKKLPDGMVDSVITY
jgi:adenine phosphoribosyltransferase